MITTSSKLRFSITAVVLSTLCTLANSQEHPGKAVYQKACALCHDKPAETNAPAYSTLTQMTARTITAALTTGKMQPQAASLSAQEKSDLVSFLASEYTGDDWIARMACPAKRKSVDLRKGPTVRGFGFDFKNSRHLTAKQAGLKTADFKQLELAWALGFPGVTAMRSQPAVVGDTIFIPIAEDSKVFAINIAGEPCVQWVYKTDTILRSGVAFGEQPNGRKIISLNDYNATVYTLDARTGELLWKTKIGPYELSLGSGTPAIYNGVVYAPVSQQEILRGAADNHLCCKTHGLVAALDAVTGKKIWEAHTMEDAKPIRDRGDGQMLWGPSGAPIWTSPVIDEKRGVLYVGTGEATSAPAHPNTDAVLAIDLKDGSIRWNFQATANDIFLVGCGRGGLNCEKDTVYLDVDFGASLILAQRRDGSDVLLAGQKSGTLWALDPDKKGKLVWREQFGTGSPSGGIHWGIAYDGRHVYAPINRAYHTPTPPPGGKEKSGIHAVDVMTGKRVWTFAAEADCSGDRKKRVNACETRIGLSGAPTVIDSAVVEGSLDGVLRIFDGQSGELLFSFNTARDFDSVNGIATKGGSIDNATIVASNGLLLVSSGYSLFNETPGNVLLAFRAKRGSSK
ncbi:MAG: PQQ-binding-like beta-propeller repeat protein [Candidatus Obscuribacterales bacterium]|nr:PQQ-binding-like beta-propeller repeat protein [Steroidobacteraceae bacterium]